MLSHLRFLVLSRALVTIGWLFGGFYAPVIAAESASPSLTVATPESQGMDGAALEQAVEDIGSGRYGDMNALLVVRNGYLVLEHYRSPEYYGRAYRHPAKSITKSVTSAVIGIVRGQGSLPPLDSRLADLLPAHADLIDRDPRKQKITLHHLLSMTAGFDWDELALGDNNEFKMMRTRDWIRYTLNQPMRDRPGERLEYNGGLSMMLSPILRDSIDGDVVEFAREHLFDPIGLENWNWNLVNDNLVNTVSGLAMSRRDMARIGVLYLNRGRWGDRQLIPADWVDLSTATQAVGEGAYYPFAYGYQWWRMQDEAPAVARLRVNDAYFALGYGGQFIFIVPHLRLVVVSTASNLGSDVEMFLKLMRERVFPATRL